MDRIKLGHYVSPDLARRLRLAAAEWDVTRSDIVEAALEKFLEQMDFRVVESNRAAVAAAIRN